MLSQPGMQSALQHCSVCVAHARDSHAAEEINADMLAFGNGKGGQTGVARQEHADITLAPVTDALLAFAVPRAGERVVDIGCGCGASTLAFARAVGPSGRCLCARARQNRCL